MQAADGLRSTIQHRPVFQRIVYSQCWEDPVVAAEGLELGAGDDLLCLTSAGCNVLALSLRRPRSLTALDFSSSQNALLELKIAALQRLSWGDYVAFLGARPADARVDTYVRHIRPSLRDEARAYFDRCQDQIATGIIHAGRFQRYLRLFRQFVLPLVHSRRTVRRLLELDDPAERRRFYDEVWDNRRWRALFRVFFGRAVMGKLGRDPEFFRYVKREDVGDNFLARARWAVVETSPRDNHFLEYALTGAYRDLERGPLYLRESNFDALRQTVEGIKIVQGDLEGHLNTLAPRSMSTFYLSDLFEWVSPDHHAAMLRAIARVSRPGGRLVYWNLLVPRSRPDSLSDLIAVHPERSRALHERDLAFVYGSFHVETVIK